MPALTTKWISVAILLVTITAFYTDMLPPYYAFTEHDKWLWILGLGLLAILQACFLICKVHKCYICRVWSDFTLQLTGLTFIILSGTFGAMFPPFSWAMGMFPIIGVFYLIAGRSFARRSREQILREHNGPTITATN